MTGRVLQIKYMRALQHCVTGEMKHTCKELLIHIGEGR